MAKSRKQIKLEEQEIKLSEVKVKIIEAIKSKFNMNVKDFAASKHASKLKLNKNLPAYLSTGSTSFPTLQILCKFLELGELKRETKIERTTKYELCPTA